MVLRADDELRHPFSDDYHWRESVYFNFNDVENQIGGWIYYWVTPNREARTGMLVSFYHGANPRTDGGQAALTSPDHVLRDGDNWLYFYNKDGEALEPANFDAVDFGGLKLSRLAPLKSYALSFEDDVGNGFDLRGEFLTAPYDYADGVHPTPAFIALNRYHRAWKTKGELRLAGRVYAVDCTGDSDHSWGTRDAPTFGSNLFKMWSFRTADGRVMISVLKQGVGGVASGETLALGFVSIDGEMSSAANVETSAEYDAAGVQSRIALRVTDALGRTVTASLDRMHSYLGYGQAFWGFEGVGQYQVEGHGEAPGLVSYFWPEHVTGAMLRAGEVA
ncbi:DUF7064 domain-containing protein [Phenylobacterium sp.]|uniref:DUF7064 domain-containing protein n=1 Tax=Phenylobacterium sp. TaxID=1871053 RepID=UPI002F41B37B